MAIDPHPWICRTGGGKLEIVARVQLMAFNSWQFLVFFVAVFTVYYLPIFRKSQPLVLLAASLIFYLQGSGALTILLIISILVNSILSYRILRCCQEKSKFRHLVVTGVLFNLLVLCFFKYGPLVTSTLKRLHFSIVPSVEWIPLPLGISFYCFEGISLLVDSSKQLFQRKKTLRDTIRDTSLFVSFFPHLISGPILRAGEFLPQIGPKELRDINWSESFKWITLGYFLKAYVGDNLADHCTRILYPEYLANSAILNCALLFGYSIQIFADFAGYSFIALGLARLLGYSIPNNFNAPYISRSLREFWRRWHISLSTWLRDYLYIPLGGGKDSRIMACRNVLVVMLLGGLWHGASWNYALWGGLHGIGLVVEHLTTWKSKQADSWLRELIQLSSTFLFVTLAWLTFIYHNPSDILRFMEHTLSNTGHRAGMPILAIALYALPVVLMHAWQWAREKHIISDNSNLRSNQARIFLFGLLIFLTVLDAGPQHAFIYFQF